MGLQQPTLPLAGLPWPLAPRMLCNSRAARRAMPRCIPIPIPPWHAAPRTWGVAAVLLRQLCAHMYTPYAHTHSLAPSRASHDATGSGEFDA
jgi:predicted amidophosphoribosyltransferase